MHRSNDLTDEPSRLKQFAWEQWENQPFAVLFRSVTPIKNDLSVLIHWKMLLVALCICQWMSVSIYRSRPGTYGLDRYVVKRYLEQVLSQSDRWRQLSICFPSITPPLRTYTLTSYEADLMQRVLDYHLNDSLHMRVTAANDQLIEYDEFVDFIRRVQDYSRSNANLSNSSRPLAGKKSGVPSIPSVHSSYVLPPSAKSLMPTSQQSTASKTSPSKPIVAKPAPAVITQANKTSSASISSNGHPSSTEAPSRVSYSAVQVKPNLISPPSIAPSSSSTISSDQSSPSMTVELCPSSLLNAKIDGSGWVQINNVFLPFIVKSRQRLIPYQVLVSCKILEVDELRSTLTRATSSDTTTMNRMIRDCKINNEEIAENAPLINAYHVLIGTKSLVYVKILPKDNPTSKINRQYKSVLALRGGSVFITCRTVPFVCSSNHSYIPLNDVLTIYPYLQTQLKPLARVPRTHELDYLQLVQMYFDEKELPADTLLIDMDDLNQRQIIPSRNTTLNEHHAKEKIKLEQQIALLNQSPNNKRKQAESQENQQSQQKFKSSSTNHQLPSTVTAPAAAPTFVRPPTGFFPTQSATSSSSSASSSSSYAPQYQQNHWLSSNPPQRGRTRWPLFVICT